MTGQGHKADVTLNVWSVSSLEQSSGGASSALIVDTTRRWHRTRDTGPSSTCNPPKRHQSAASPLHVATARGGVLGAADTVLFCSEHLFVLSVLLISLLVGGGARFCFVACFSPNAHSQALPDHQADHLRTIDLHKRRARRLDSTSRRLDLLRGANTDSAPSRHSNIRTVVSAWEMSRDGDTGVDSPHGPATAARDSTVLEVRSFPGLAWRRRAKR